MAGHGPATMTGGASLEHLPFGLAGPLIEALQVIAAVVDLIGVSIILFGFVIALVQVARALSRGVGLRRDVMGVERARTTLATYILTGLEFMIASDIVHTVITRELGDLLFVGLLVVIRTAISFFLGKEAMALREEAQAPPRAP